MIVLENFKLSAVQVEQVRDTIDQNRNKSRKYGTKWRFKNRKIAEKEYFAILMTI